MSTNHNETRGGILHFGKLRSQGNTPGLGTAFFCVQNVTFFCVQKRESYVLFRSFFEFLATYETQKNVTFFSVLLKRTEKNGKNVTSFCKEQKRTRERNVLLQMNLRTLRSFFEIYIEIYIDIYRYIQTYMYRKKNGTFFKKNGTFFLRSFGQVRLWFGWLGQEKNVKKNVPFFLKERERTERTERSFKKNVKERKERNVLLKRT